MERQGRLGLGQETERNPLLASDLHTTRHPLPGDGQLAAAASGTRS